MLFARSKFAHPTIFSHFCPHNHYHTMQSNALFYLGLAVNAITLLVTIGGISTMFEPTQNLDGSYDGGNIGDGMTALGKLVTWLIPLVLIAWVAFAFWLRAKGKVLAANIIMCIPALPMLAGIVIWGGLALLFILFGK